jgi:hypothetical protein
MTDKDFNKVLDHYLITGKMKSEHYEMMSEEQQNIIQIIKRAFARIKNKIDEN